MTTISRERLLHGYGKLVVMSWMRPWEGFGVLEDFDPFGEGHFSYRPPGHVGAPLTDDIGKLLDGGLMINDVFGEALINTNGLHDYVVFSRITDRGLVKVPLKFSAKERWLPPPIPGGNWEAREITYLGPPRQFAKVHSHTASLQSYKLRERWEYTDFETGTVVPVDLPHSITDPD